MLGNPDLDGHGMFVLLALMLLDLDAHIAACNGQLAMLEGFQGVVLAPAMAAWHVAFAPVSVSKCHGCWSI